MLWGACPRLTERSIVRVFGANSEIILPTVFFSRRASSLAVRSTSSSMSSLVFMHLTQTHQIICRKIIDPPSTIRQGGGRREILSCDGLDLGGSGTSESRVAKLGLQSGLGIPYLLMNSANSRFETSKNVFVSVLYGLSFSIVYRHQSPISQ